MQPQIENKVEEKIVQENSEPTQPIIETQKEKVPKSSKDWERFREARAQDRKKAEEMAKQAEKSAAEAAALRAALDAALNKSSTQNVYGYDQQEETEEQRIEKKVQQAIEKREQEARKIYEEREKQELPKRLAQNHQDFDQVCSSENLDYLEYHYPEIATPFKYMPDGYEKWSSIYKAVKKFVPNTNSGDAMKKAEKNLQKPQSVSSPTVATPGQGSLPVVLDEARKAANWERMQRSLKGLD